MTVDVRQEVALDTRREFLAAARKFAAETRLTIASIVESGIETQVKTDRSLVTKADTAVERQLRERIAERWPEHGVLGEEFGGYRLGADYRWIIDPIDGTEAFVHGIPTYGCVLSLFYRDLPLIGLLDNPALGLCTSGGYGLGVECGGAPLPPLGEAGDKDDETLRVIVSKRKNFLRTAGGDQVFDTLTKTFPNILIFDSCYAYTALLHGAVDVLVDYNVRLWDISAVLALAPELGGRSELLAETRQPDGGMVYSAAVGKADAVRRILGVLR